MKNFAAPAFSLEGKVALVTGATEGVGRACAVALAAAGADVVLGLPRRGAGAEVGAEVEALERRALAVPLDVTKPDQIRRAVATAVRQLGRIDILVNNAGASHPAPGSDVSDRQFEATIALNLKGAFFVAREVARAMVAAQRGGRIIQVASPSGWVRCPAEAVYGMAKAGLAHLTKSLALEWAPHGILVNAVVPTCIALAGGGGGGDDEAARQNLVRRVPLGRFGTPEDVAAPVVFLASPAAAFITGATLMVDGGSTLC